MNSRGKPENRLGKLQKKWGLQSMKQVIIVLLVFACAGFTVVIVKRPIVAFFSGEGEPSGWFAFLYWVLIFPIYNIILLFYGFVFGQYKFFMAYEKRIINRLRGKRGDVKSP